MRGLAAAHSIAIFFIGFQFLCLFEGLILSLISIFALKLLDIHLIKKVSLKWLYPINSGAYILISIITFAYLNLLLIISLDFWWLNLSILLVMQFYTIYAVFLSFKQFNRFTSEKSLSYKAIIQNVLLNSIFVIVCIYGSSFFTSLVIVVDELLIGVPAWLFNIMLFLY